MSTITGNVYCERCAEVIHFGNGLVELRIDVQSGRWFELRDLRDDRAVFHAGQRVAPLVLTVGGQTLASRGIHQLFSVVDAETIGLHWQCEGYELVSGDDRAVLCVRLREENWRAELQYGLRPGSTRLERRFRLEYLGDDEVLLRSVVLRLPFATLGRPVECQLEVPGYPLKPGRYVSSLPFGPWGQLLQGPFCDAPAWRPPLIGMHNPTARRAIALWSFTETEPFYPMVDRSDDGVAFSHRIFLADRFRCGHALEWGTQYVEVLHEDWLSALAHFQSFYDEIGFEVPKDVPDWAKSVNIYEVHVGTLTGTSLAPYPTYEPLIDDLPRIREKGYDVVYIMPHVPYPSYSVIDYHNMDVQQGSEAGFRRFVARAHELGLKVFIDVTLHGVMDRRARRLLGELESRSPESYPMEPSMPEVHPYLTEHPEWFSRHESGAIAMTYTYAFDHANPGWQDFMASVFRYYVEEYDVDGFRVDSHTWNFFPNWAEGLPYPASRSFYGSAQLFKRIRRELKAIKPDVVFYTETPGPLIQSSHELSYNYDETWMLVSTFPVLTRNGLLCHFLHPAMITAERMTARDVAQWLTQWRLVMPRGAIKVRHLDCHDSYWRSKEFRRDTFGLAQSRAIVGFFAFIDGGFMDYNCADEGSEDFYRRVVYLRRTHPVLRHGDCDYLAVQPTDPMVFAPLRTWQGRFVLPVINFGSRQGRVRLPLPVDRLSVADDAYEVRDLVGDRQLPGPTGLYWQRDALAALEVEVAPYGVMLLDFRPLSSESTTPGRG